jgi:hypothetical protein
MSNEPPFISGEMRHWNPPVRRDPHTVLRVDTLNRQVLVKYADRTTAWEPIDWYQASTDTGNCGWPLPHRNKHKGSWCSCVCHLTSAHSGAHRCERETTDG